MEREGIYKQIDREIKELIETIEYNKNFEFLLIEGEGVNFMEDWFFSYYDVEKLVKAGYPVKQAVYRAFRDGIARIRVIMDDTERLVVSWIEKE